MNPRFELFHTETRTIHSAHVGQAYRLGVWLPFSYAHSDRTYPVLYVLDAEYAFGLATGLIPTLIGTGEVPEMIVAGIAYDAISAYGEFGSLRERDYLPPDFADAPAASRTPGFLSFLADEVFPLLETEYRASPTDRTVYGFSAAGFFALYALLTRPDLFRRAIAASCTWPGAGEYLVGCVRRCEPGSVPATVYLAVGALEEEQLPGFQAVTEALRARHDTGLTLHAQILPGENHSAGVLAQSFLCGLRIATAARLPTDATLKALEQARTREGLEELGSLDDLINDLGTDHDE